MFYNNPLLPLASVCDISVKSKTASCLHSRDKCNSWYDYLGEHCVFRLTCVICFVRTTLKVTSWFKCYRNHYWTIVPMCRRSGWHQKYFVMNHQTKSKLYWLKTRFKYSWIILCLLKQFYVLAGAMFLAMESYYGSFVHYYNLGKGWTPCKLSEQLDFRIVALIFQITSILP